MRIIKNATKLFTENFTQVSSVALYVLLARCEKNHISVGGNEVVVEQPVLIDVIKVSIPVEPSQ